MVWRFFWDDLWGEGACGRGDPPGWAGAEAREQRETMFGQEDDQGIYGYIYYKNINIMGGRVGGSAGQGIYGGGEGWGIIWGADGRGLARLVTMVPADLDGGVAGRRERAGEMAGCFGSVGATSNGRFYDVQR